MAVIQLPFKDMSLGYEWKHRKSTLLPVGYYEVFDPKLIDISSTGRPIPGGLVEHLNKEMRVINYRSGGFYSNFVSNSKYLQRWIVLVKDEDDSNE